MVKSPSIRLVQLSFMLSFCIICWPCASMWAQKPALATTKIDTLKTPIPIMGATTKRLPERIAKADSTSKMPKKEAIVANSAPKPPKMENQTTAKGIDKSVVKATDKTVEKATNKVVNGTVEKTVEKTTEKGPLSKTAEKTTSPVVAAPKTVESAVAAPKTVAPVIVSPTQAVIAPTQAVVAPTQTAKIKVNVSPINAANAGKMGNCIAFYPNKAVISENSMACLKEMSQFLITNKNLKLNVAASLLPTEKTTDAVALKTERAKTIRNYFIQSGVEASRIAVKLSDKMEETPIVMTPQ